MLPRCFFWGVASFLIADNSFSFGNFRLWGFVLQSSYFKKFDKSQKSSKDRKHREGASFMFGKSGMPPSCFSEFCQAF
jgi:hypothetical protein